MSQHPLPDRPARRGLSPFASLRAFAAVGLGLAGFAPTALASDPAPVPPAVAGARPAGFSDVVLARSVLAALDADPELRGANLVVSVVDRVALIGGPVSDDAVSRRAEQVARRVDGIREVKNACFVSAGPDPLLKAVADRVGSSLPPRPVQIAELPGVLTPHPAPGWPGQTSPPPSAFAAGNPTGRTVVVRKPEGDAGGVLGGPVNGSQNPRGPGSPGVLTATVPPVPVVAAKPGDVLTAAGEVKNSDPRFSRLTVELRDGTVVVGGAAPLASDAWDFAGKLRQVPGVARVAVGAVEGK